MSDSKHFERPSLPLCTAILVGMGLCHLGCYNPTLVPDEYMGPVGALYRYFVYTKPATIQVIYHLALAIHFCEACYGVTLARRKGITDLTAQLKWFVSTCLFGGGSLYKLHKFKQSTE